MRAALELFRELRDPQREDAEILFNIGLCEKELAQFSAAGDTFSVYTAKFAGRCRRLGQPGRMPVRAR